MAKKSTPLKALILAGGKGSRLKSRTPKPLVDLCGQPMIGYVIDALKKVGVEDIAVVVGNTSEGAAVKSYAQEKNLAVYTQDTPLGTAHAVLSAKEYLSDKNSRYLVLCADTPLIQAKSLMRLLDATADHGSEWAGSFLAMKVQLPHAFGALVLDEHDQIQSIVEASERQFSQATDSFDICNSGICLLNGSHALSLLSQINNKNSKGEFFLTDYPLVAKEKGLTCTAIVNETTQDLLGINTPLEYATAVRALQTQWREQAMAQGVLLQAPETIYFSFDTQIEPGVSVEPNVVFGSGVQIKSDAVIRAFSHLEGALVDSNAVIGPYARLRPGTQIGEKAKIGNFVEVKKSQIAAGAKANHLSYIGDAFVEENVNIGAGTITCNYDGINKSQTTIKRGAFIGSNTALVAPVTIGEDATVGAGSTITKDVADSALAISRTPQKNIDGYKNRKQKSK